jgi:hypothetical protein
MAALLHLDVIPVKHWVMSSPRPDVEAVSPEPAVPFNEPPPETEAEPDTPMALAAYVDVERDPATTFRSFVCMRPRAPRRGVTLPASALDAESESRDRSEPRNRSERPRRNKTRRRKTTKPRPKLASRARPRPSPVRRPEPAPATRPAPKKSKAVSRSGGQSCSAAIAGYREAIKMGDNSMPADITAARYGAVLNSGSYFSHCGVPDTMRIHICAAVQNGVAVGVTVTTNPGSSRVASCIASAVRGLSFPSHPRMDVTRTTFE